MNKRVQNLGNIEIQHLEDALEDLREQLDIAEEEGDEDLIYDLTDQIEDIEEEINYERYLEEELF